MPYKDPEKDRACIAAWRAANQEKLRAYNAARRAANPEKIRAQKAAYYAANREKVRAWLAAYHAANRASLLTKKVACKLAKTLGVHTADIPQDMLAVKIAIINIQREVKRHENA